MKTGASKKKQIAAMAAAIMVCICTAASAQSYSLGDEADEVATIQTALTELGLYSADITGHFGEKTETAVKKFQKKYAFETNGIVDEDVFAELCKAAGISASGSSSSSSSSSGSGSSSASSSTLLKAGDESTAVRQLQENLAALGYYSGSITGHFGSITQEAVKKFQRQNGLSADGVAGSKTLDKIAQMLGSGSASGSSSDSSSSGSGSGSTGSSTLLKEGDESDAVRQLQENLTALGYYSGSITGHFGSITQEAVKKFQRQNGLSADGIAGSKTLDAISSKMSGNSSSSSGSSSSSSSSSSYSALTLDTTKTLQRYSEGDEVRKLQTMLSDLGYYSGNKTGSFGELTKEAVIAFQQAKGLSADGIAGPRTLAALNAAHSSGSVASSGGSVSLSVQAASVLDTDFYTWRRDYENGEYCTVYDFETGYSWTLRIMSKDNHMDAEPLTAQDVEEMNKAFGGKTTWTPKAVWVTFSDGKTYIGATANTPHGTQHLGNNNFEGHLCVHFPIDMDKAISIGTNATAFQKAILSGWEKTQELAR